MKTPQYTIRNIPEPVDQYLRKRAKVTGRSLNQVVLDELSENAGLNQQNLADSLDWFIGAGTIEDASLAALAEDDKKQKELTKKQWHKDNDN